MKNQKNNISQKTKPILEWQIGKFGRYADFKFVLPYQFLLICRLMDVTPETVVSDFMDNLSCGSWKRQGRDEAKEKLIAYFIEHKYGQHHYSSQDIQQIFKELDAIGLLFPKDAKDKMLDLHSKWREKYYHYWFKKWFKKPRKLMQK